ncbi:hypothetical protein [Actinoplanes sp. M2I2]|uniref:hypothetical protein n=1 Tax=Actinoplanes sp. M2I2 TaxID=1734444 RepID=UPI00202052F3|nr:hypothetical protein [Actinoplanes sp. M2I2]
MTGHDQGPVAPDGRGRELISAGADPTGASANERPEPAAASSEGEPLQPGEARVEEDDKEKILGSQYERQRFSRNRAKGQSMWGDGNIQNIFSERMAPTFRRPAQMESLTDYYVPTDEKEEKALRAALERHATVCLVGEPETGRFSTACMALRELFGPNIEEILPPPDQSPVEAIHQVGTEDLTLETGYLLRIENSDPDPYIKRLDALMRENRAQLILIRNASSPPRSNAEVAHLPPSPKEVFKAHVRWLGEASGRDVTGYRRLADTVPLPRKPRDVVWLASESLKHSPGEAEDLAHLQDLRALRKRATDALVDGPDVANAGRRRLPQHRRAFRLAYVAMAGRPIGRVFDATGHLLRMLDAASGWDDLGRTALEHPVTTLLGEDLAAQWQSADNPRRLARVDDELARSIFDVAWHEFDHTRPALLTWLRAMVEDSDAGSRDAAVRAAVILALVDFDSIWREVIDEWSRSPKSRVRLAAAKAALYLGSANRVQHLVARKVHGWARGTNYQRDAAAGAYADGLLLSDRRWILADLHEIGTDPLQKRGWTIAAAASRLLTSESRRLIVGTLVGWIREDGPARVVTRHAARAFVRMVPMPHEDGRSPVPVLLSGLAEGDLLVEQLSELWYPALLGASTGREAWNGLLAWLRRADHDSALRPSVQDLLRDMATPPALRRRLLLCLSRPDAPEWIAALTEEWK